MLAPACPSYVFGLRLSDLPDEVLKLFGMPRVLGAQTGQHPSRRLDGLLHLFHPFDWREKAQQLPEGESSLYHVFYHPCKPSLARDLTGSRCGFKWTYILSVSSCRFSVCVCVCVCVVTADLSSWSLHKISETDIFCNEINTSGSEISISTI